MRLVTEVTELVPGERASGGRRTSERDFYFDGHFPGNPVVPAIILVELVAQVGGLAAGAPLDQSTQDLRKLRVAALGPFKFPSAAGPGVYLEARTRIAGRMGGLYKIEGEVTADGRTVAVGAVTLAEV